MPERVAYYRQFDFYLFLMASGLFIFDYLEHILRTGEIFQKHPWYWLGFSTASYMSFLLVVFGLRYGLQKVTKSKNVLFEVLAIAVWLLLHIHITGPLFNKVFWPFTDMVFRFQFNGFFMVLGLYFVIRVLLNIVLRKKIFYSG